QGVFLAHALAFHLLVPHAFAFVAITIVLTRFAFRLNCHVCSRLPPPWCAHAEPRQREARLGRSPDQTYGIRPLGFPYTIRETQLRAVSSCRVAAPQRLGIRTFFATLTQAAAIQSCC